MGRCRRKISGLCLPETKIHRQGSADHKKGATQECRRSYQTYYRENIHGLRHDLVVEINFGTPLRAEDRCLQWRGSGTVPLRDKDIWSVLSLYVECILDF
jgi:hypothetical protein